MRRRRQRPLQTALLGLVLLTSGCTCGHNRQVMYPGGTRASNHDEIRVRAPFVDVRVPRHAKSSRVSAPPADLQPALEVED